MLQNGVGWMTSSSSGPLPLTAVMESEIPETTVPEAAAIAETAIAEAATIAEAAAVQETTVPETAIAEATIPETAVAEERGAVREDGKAAVQKQLGRGRGHFLGAEFGETRRPILQIAARERGQIADRFGCLGERGACNHNRAQRTESTPCEGA
jgi:hypothetical protein